MLFSSLKQYCQQTLPFSGIELELIDSFFEAKTLKKKEYLWQEGKTCPFIAFIDRGSIRHFHLKNGLEKTCDLSFENAWVTDFSSFTQGVPGKMNLQAMESSQVYLIRRENLQKLYQSCAKYETFGRLMAEQVAQRASDIAMSLSADRPEERFQELIKNQPLLLQRVPQKYVANFLGISPESLSRIRSRIYNKIKS
jgi:CRP-like cAMP-binding protein